MLEYGRILHIFAAGLRIMSKPIKKMNAMFRRIVIVVGVVVAIVAFAIEARAQSHEGLLYGKVYLNDRSYEGPIRWGNEEALWTDFFNASKGTNQYQNMIPEGKKNEESWYDFDWNLSSIWEDKVVAHQFSTQFGNISVMTPMSRNRVNLKFKNGSELEVEGEGYNDVGAKIQVIDEELGVINLNWDRITKIEFMPTPTKAPTIFGSPLFGTVEGVRKEKFKGYIIWDNDERLSLDKLDGDDDDGDVSIRFKEIERIEKSGNGCDVTLKSGKTYYLTNSNDVNSGNRGVFVAIPDVGVVKLKWSAFRRVVFTEPDVKPQGYNDFQKPNMLKGTITRLDSDTELSGTIIYDIDETLDIEVLEGEENNIEYIIPMKNIKQIVPKNDDYATVELRNKEKLLLGDSQDVSSRNGGVLVFGKQLKKPQFVRWRDINDITFD
jgi:hypothetical protein